MISATVLPVAPKSTTNSLKKPSGNAIRTPSISAEAPGRVVAAGDDQPAELGEALRPHQRHVDGVRDRPEVDRVARPVVALLAAAVRRLLEERDPEAVLARDRLGDAEQQRRVLVRVARVVARGDEAAGAAAARHVDAERLRAADDDVGAVVGRRREDAERDRVDADDRLRAVAARERRDLGRVRLDPAEEGGVLEEHGGGARREPLLEIVEVDAAGHRVVGDELDLDLARTSRPRRSTCG